MSKECCILHANCQAEPLAAALALNAGFAERYDVLIVTNYTRQPVPEGALARCTLLLHQHLGPKWGELASERLRAALPAGARALCVPNMFFTGYWPLWSSEPGFDFRDRLLDELLARGLPAQDALHVHLGGSLAAKYDLAALLEATFETERRRQALTPVPYLDHLLAHWRSRRLFDTVNHPGRELLALAAEGILAELGLGGLPEDAIRRIPDIEPEFVLPIHPQVAAFHGLAFADETTRYPVFGAELTYAEYAARYVECRSLGEADFTGYLRARADLERGRTAPAPPGG